MSSGNKKTGNPFDSILSRKDSPASPMLKPVGDFVDDIVRGESGSDETPESESPLEEPRLDDASVLAASAEERRKSRRGRASTILTGGSGLSDVNLSLARQTLMGS